MCQLGHSIYTESKHMRVYGSRDSPVMAAPSDGILPMDMDKGALVFQLKLSSCRNASVQKQPFRMLLISFTRL